VKKEKIEKLLKALQEEDGTNIAEVEFSKETDKIIIPDGMTKEAASRELRRQHDADQQIVNVMQIYEGYHWQDSLYALKSTAEETFGWISPDPAARKPIYLKVHIDTRNDVKEFAECFFGKFLIPQWDDATCEVGFFGQDIVINLNVKQQFKPKANIWLTKVETFLKEKSIYKGKAVVVSSAYTQGTIRLEFEIIEMKASSRIFLNRETEETLEKYVIPELLGDEKFTCLFTGPYGNG